MTDLAEQLEKFEREVSPAPTSPPTTLEMRLFPRDYSLPSDYCGWNVELKCEYFPLALLSQRTMC
jgi:hypothetical protein